jgi:acetyl/propionyl-CoA carboxylase alpha subunit
MYFQAESQGKKYEMNVSELKDSWNISIREEDSDWKYFDIPKSDYQRLESTISFIFNNSSYLIDVVPWGTEYNVYTRGSYRSIKVYNEETLLHESLKAGGAIGSGGDLEAGMPGKIVKVLVEEGQEVKAGDPLLIMEAMKMENEMKASADAKVKKILVSTGDSVERGALLITFDS